ncbi:MAG: hypothetical protein LC789_12795 [Actinobacteria bacterium]|nr:hypothetical protein [Actinomycetota bacterium]MCA1719952.1 hypothetical protein [Actinomycetota bacterium]
MNESRRRPVASWPASLLPTLALLALLAGSAATTTSGDSTPVVEMTVSTNGR